MASMFIAAPVAFFEFDPATSRGHAKMTQRELRDAMACVPELYRRQVDGATDVDFRRMSQSPPGTHERQLGDTYRHLFSTSPSARPLTADLLADGRLLAVAGQHRLAIAKDLGLQYVPVHVTARSHEELERVRTACEAEILRLDPSARPTLIQQRQRDSKLHTEAERERTSDGPSDGLKYERDIGWQRPERWR
jgi:hypothetical protein